MLTDALGVRWMSRRELEDTHDKKENLWQREIRE
jgi:hypothetical protein